MRRTKPKSQIEEEEEPEEEELFIPDNAEEQFALQQDALFRRAAAGDNQASRLWLQLQEKLAARKSFDIHVSIVPYDISDASLSRIISQADISVVVEMLKGLLTRMEVDGAPRPLRDDLLSVTERYKQWFDVLFAVRDD
jgi:predicted NBD/HSP70 family sugar kinase